MGDEGEEAPPYVWTQTDPLEDEAPQTANYVKTPGRLGPRDRGCHDVLAPFQRHNHCLPQCKSAIS